MKVKAAAEVRAGGSIGADVKVGPVEAGGAAGGAAGEAAG